MKLRELRQLIRESIVKLHESSFSVNSDVDRAFNSVGVYPPKMVSVSGDRYEGEIDASWKLTYDEKSKKIDVNGQNFNSLIDAANYYKQNKGKKASASSKSWKFVGKDRGPVFEKIRDELEYAMSDEWDDDRVQKNVSGPLHDAFAPNGHATPKGMRAVDDILHIAGEASNIRREIEHGNLADWYGDEDRAVIDYEDTLEQAVDMLEKAWDIHTKKY